MGEMEKKYVDEAFATNWVAPLGPNVNAFENALEQRLGVNGVVSLSSGTAALHLALVTLDVRPGDVVICQSFTFAASAFPIRYCGAEPVFVDSESETWNMDPVLMEEAITDCLKAGKKPAAIVVVHLYGMPADMDRINAVAHRYDIPVIEDAAEALGSTYHGRPCGNLGAMSLLSFNGNKIITTSGGGAFASSDAGRVQQVRHLSAQAKEPVPYYLHKDIGYNFRMSNICAGIGRGQMEVLDQRIARRREVFDIYRKALGGIPGVTFLAEPPGSFSNRWLTTVLFDRSVHPAGTNERIRLFLEQSDIESRHLWKPLHQQPVFESCRFFGQGTSDRLFDTGLCLPSGSNLSDETLHQVIGQIKIALS